MANPVSSILDLLANLFGFARKRQDLANTPEMQANAQAAADQKLKDTAATAIAAQDLAEVRRRLAP